MNRRAAKGWVRDINRLFIECRRLGKDCFFSGTFAVFNYIPAIFLAFCLVIFGNFVYLQLKEWYRFLNNENMRTNESIKRNDVLDLTKQGLSTFYNIAQMTRYRYLYILGKDSQNDGSIHNTSELNQNKEKMIKYTCLAGWGILTLFAIGICGLRNRE